MRIKKNDIFIQHGIQKEELFFFGHKSCFPLLLKSLHPGIELHRVRVDCRNIPSLFFGKNRTELNRKGIINIFSLYRSLNYDN